ncbi:MAG: metal ABC transporter solute-binding protein, Zn/Mn family, partial [Candidatus Methanospirareceae archaeon]
WMDKIIAINPDMLVIDTSQGIELIDNDPHIWTSPLNAKRMVENICNGLVQIDPDNAAFYRKNKNNYLKELDILDGYVHYKLDRFMNRVFMAYHPAFGYFARDYNLTQLAIERAGKEPTPKVLQDCISKAREYNLQYIFVAPQFTTKQCEIIAKEIGGEIVPMDPLAKNYISNMGYIVDLLAKEFEN